MDMLPTDENPLSQDQKNILTGLFGNAPVASSGDSLLETLKVPLLAGGLAAASNFPGLDGTISKFTGIDSPYILMLIKGVIATIVFWLVHRMM